MPAIQNVERRGAVYYWRGTVRLSGGNHLTLRISLGTTDQSIARRMVAGSIYKRAWVQHRTGVNDWGSTGRYLNVVRFEASNTGPSGQAADFPIFLSPEEASDDRVLADFVRRVCVGQSGTQRRELLTASSVCGPAGA